MTDPHAERHAFISYVREDAAEVDRLQRVLEAAGIPVLRDTENLWPGQDWEKEIGDAIGRGSLVFLACFSDNSSARERSYQNEELVLAVKQMRQRQPGQPGRGVGTRCLGGPLHDVGSPSPPAGRRPGTSRCRR